MSTAQPQKLDTYKALLQSQKLLSDQGGMSYSRTPSLILDNIEEERHFSFFIKMLLNTAQSLLISMQHMRLKLLRLL